MYHVRKTKTASGATAVQVVRYQKRKTAVCSHIGSTHDKEKIILLEQEAVKWIENATGQAALFPVALEKQKETILVVSKSQYMGVRYTFLYEVLSKQMRRFSFHALENQLLFDLTLIRIVEPASKLESLKLLSTLFGINYHRGHVYEALAAMSSLKEQVEKAVIQIAKQHFSFDFSMVFYDVTTLYYESFTEDEDTFDEEGNMIEKGLRKSGLGKEVKIGQPIIVIGLMVTKEGFPVSFEVYEGNTFEGDTFIPSILSFKKKHTIQTLTIVADAAMISFDNVEKLKEHELSYIVGGRMASLKNKEMKQINEELTDKNQTGEELQKIDGKSMRIQTERGLLICDFSFKRYLKDKREMEKQIIRAENLVTKNTDGKRTKFLMLKQSGKKRKRKGEEKEKTYTLNTKLIEKTKLLLGIKGYYTNLFEKDEKLTNQDIINHYHSLWHAEKAFRIAKSDLQARPIYHRKRETIEAHTLICFMALAVCQYMELKTKKSTKHIVQLLRSVTEASIRNRLTGEIVTFREELSSEIEQLWKTLLEP